MSTIPAQKLPPLPADSAARLQALMAGGQRKLLGLVGAPGAGKSTLAAALLQSLGADCAQVVPMDGFHLANVELQRLGRSGRKGAPDTFDSAGYVALLQRLREQRPDGDIVYAPNSAVRSRSRLPAPLRCCRRLNSSSAKATTCCTTSARGLARRRCSTRSGTWTSTMRCVRSAWCGATSSSAAAPRRRAPGWRAPMRPMHG